jgi:hypothetical protein
VLNLVCFHCRCMIYDRILIAFGQFYNKTFPKIFRIGRMRERGQSARARGKYKCLHDGTDGRFYIYDR